MKAGTLTFERNDHSRVIVYVDEKNNIKKVMEEKIPVVCCSSVNISANEFNKISVNFKNLLV